jgi:acetyl-CoA carboxylase carboxyl transferase subunit alpha
MKNQTLDFEKPIVELEGKLADLKAHSREHEVDVETEVRRMEMKIEETKKHIYLNLTAWERVQIARHPGRPYTLDYLQLSFSDFVELHGDRLFGDDRAMPGGFATIDGRKCVVIGQQKGRELKENLKRNFGCANPEGYRKALRLNAPR